VAYVVLNQVADTAGADIAGQLRPVLRRTLPEYMIPATFVVMPSFPVTTSGKTDRRALPPPHAERSLPGTAYVPPRTAVEAQVADLWAELLGVEYVGVKDSFFELGGHSLLGIRMVSRVRAAFRVDIPLRAIFETPTVAALSQRIESDAGRHESGEAPEIIGRSRKDHAMRLLPNGELHALGTARPARDNE
jgi:acyl carrier protein